MGSDHKPVVIKLRRARKLKPKTKKPGDKQRTSWKNVDPERFMDEVRIACGAVELNSNPGEDCKMITAVLVDSIARARDDWNDRRQLRVDGAEIQCLLAERRECSNQDGAQRAALSKKIRKAVWRPRRTNI
ncbi:unnamed protein product [Prorocentrum cordatum]|uniref:Ribosome biogenesis protein NOP53 n=1 Tax=Prorocentrum cordatum TaxID=2364126 RepID=A0ABN9Y095_9DINO|nr:unnamed protein product [Polarella glacialis]